MSLPSGYTRLEYIESTGTQYIDTGFKPNQNTRVLMDVTPLHVVQSNMWCAFGCRANGLYFGLYKASSGNMNLTWFYGSVYSNYFTIDYTKRHVIEVNKNVANVDGATKSYSAQVFQLSQSMFLFCDNDSGTATSLSSSRLYSCKVYDNGTLVRDFIPCKNASGVVGLWDNANNQFYANAGSGGFTSGPVYIGTHKTLINGTLYDVTGGKCLVNGTVYDILKGRTLVNGTGYDITFGPSYDTVFANNTWEQIIAACHSGSVPSAWAVGNSKPMTINGVDYQIDIIGKNHDDYSDGSGKAPLTFQLHDCYGTRYVINSTNTNIGGWGSSDMRLTHLTSILALMPTEVQSGIREVNKLTSGGFQSAINTTADKLFLLSEIEIFGMVNNSKSGEGTQYDYYKAGNSKVKKYNGSVYSWWERSPNDSDTERFCHVNTKGFADSYNARVAFGVAFAFCF